MTLPALQPWIRPCEAVAQLLSSATARSCLPVAVVVRTLPSLVNEGDVLLRGALGVVVAVTVLPGYAIPFLTGSTGTLLAVRQARAGR